MWIWQQSNWPKFEYDAEIVMLALSDAISHVAPLMLLANELDQDKKLALESKSLLDEALSSAKIEGEILDRDSVRSSIANRLGIGKVGQVSRNSAAFIDVLLESIRSSSSVLTKQDLFKWHGMMFLDKPILDDLIIGDYRKSQMKVVSGRYGKERVHFEAPCLDYQCVGDEMNVFLNWLKSDNIESGYIKAAIAKFYFVTIHPFDDGNGRFSRMIAERFLADAENTNIRLYSLSTEMEKNKNEYYEILEKCQKGELDVTQWIVWFLEQVKLAAQNSMHKLNKIRNTTLFWDKHRNISMNDRQRKLVVRLLETEDFTDGISRKKYKNLVGTTDITAARDLIDLSNKGILISSGGGRSTKYHIDEN